MDEDAGGAGSPPPVPLAIVPPHHPPASAPSQQRDMAASPTSSRSVTETVNGSHRFVIQGYSLAKGMGVGKHIAFSAGGGGLWGRPRRGGTGAAAVEADDRGDAEQRALAAALAAGRLATVLEFYSPRCRLSSRAPTEADEGPAMLLPFVPLAFEDGHAQLSASAAAVVVPLVPFASEGGHAQLSTAAAIASEDG